MTEIWETSSLSPVINIFYNWKLEDFPQFLKFFGLVGVESSQFNIVASDGKTHSLKLKILELNDVNNPIKSIKDEGVKKSVDEYAIIEVKLLGVPSDLMLVGTVDFVIDGKTCLGDLHSKTFINKSLVEFRSQRTVCFTPLRSGFCVSKVTPILQMKVQLTTPGAVSNTISLVSGANTVKDKSARLVSDLKSLLTNANDNSDFTIVCEEQNFPCHETILKARSPVLDTMFQNKMKESFTRELIIEDVKKETIGLLLEYLYTGEINKKVENDSELIYIADKYQIAGLLDLCFHKLPEVEEKKVVDILLLADRHNLEDFKKVTMQRILRNKSKFLKDEDFMTKLKQYPGILMDFFKL